MRNDGLFTYARDGYRNYFYTISKKNYLFRVTFINADGYAVDFTKGAIAELYINDNVYNPFKTSYINVENTDDVIERFRTLNVDKEFANTTTERGYKTRGDARDLVFITIIPCEPSTNPYDEQSLQYNKTFGFQYIFVISNEEDIITNTGKQKKYTLKDVDEQVLRERKIFFSTTELLNNKDIASLSNKDRQAYTGDCIKAILRKGLGDQSVVFSSLSGGSEISPEFEKGSSRLFYSSPSSSTALDDLIYMYSLHATNDPDKDFSFLNKDNFTGEYSLQSASSIFSKAYNKTNDSGGQYFIENFTIPGGGNLSNVLQNDLKKPLKALEFGETSDVISVKFFNTPGTEYQDRIKTTLVHSYSVTDKLFDIDSINGDVTNVKKDFSSLYVEPMKGKDNKPSPNFILNNTQKTNVNYDDVFLIYTANNEFLRLAVGRNEILKNALKLNLGVELLVQGGFQRKAGKFISIDRSGNYIDNEFDNKFLGIYFILNVEHIIINDSQYYNKIIAVKTYHFSDPKINENIP